MKKLFVRLAVLIFSLPVLAGEPTNFRIEGLSLYADSGIIIKPFTLSAKRISHLPSFSSDMINVTDGCEGYRLLPNGEHFFEPATIAIAYNPARLPIGYTPDDIYTFCYDSAVGHWLRLNRLKVDTVEHFVYSATTHFSDFANFVIRVPEMPESKAFVPTDMQDLPDPDPLTGVPMIEVPKPNNMGTAELTYPITLPPGRHGLQPDLDLHYSSAGGNGLLGVGWSIAQPAITIDTRWGVPRYDLRYETEAYLVNGEPFLLHDTIHDEPIPLPHMASSFEPRRAQATRFYARDQRNQSKAVRHGQLPDRYWWSVTTTDGVTYYYGYNPFIQSIDEQSIIRTAQGNIGYWALTCIIDRLGNFVRYFNSKDAYNELLIDSISYTGHALLSNMSTNLPPHYHVLFRYYHRPDTITDARLGVIKRQTQRLCQLRIRTRDNIQVSNYQFMYHCSPSSLFKSRIDSIIKIDTDIAENAECQVPFSTMYGNNEDWIHQEDQLYGQITKDTAGHSVKPASVTTLTYYNAFSHETLFSSPVTLSPDLTDFSTSLSEGWNIGGAVTIGGGYNTALTCLSGGVNYAYERNKGAVKTMLIDLNGDGLLDHLSVSGNTVYYRKQNPNKTFAAPITISGLSELSREVSNSHTFGAQLDCFGNLSYNPSVTTSYTDVYFADINADNLPDLVTPSGVKLNTLTNAGVPSFNPVSDVQTDLDVHGNNCSRAIYFGGEVDENLMCDVTYERLFIIPLSELIPSDDGEAAFIEHDMEPDPDEDERSAVVEHASDANHQQGETRYEEHNNWYDILSHYCEGDDCYFEIVGSNLYVYRKYYHCNRPQDEPNVDIVRVWVSDRNDSICLSSLFYLLRDTSYSRTQSQYADGVSLRIQHNKGVTEQNGHLYASSQQLLYNGTIDADDYDSLLTTYRLSVQQGDVLFFRMSARDDRRFDDAHWQQTITSISGDTLYNSARDYICTDKQNFTAPAAGTALVTLSCTNSGTVPVQIRAMHQSDTILYHTLPAMSMLDTVITRAVTDTNVIAFYVDTLSQEPIWSNIRIVPTVDYWGSLVIDTLNHTLPDTISYHPDIHLQHSSFYASETNLYRRLFGPLHKGWGQFAYNNINNANIITLSDLQNEEDLAAQYATTHQSQYSTYNPAINVNDSVQMAYIQANGVDSYFSNINAYDPLADDKRWIAMHADNMSNTWQAYGNTGSLGQYLHSTSRQLKAVADTTIITEDIPEYDSPVPTKYGGLQRVTTIRKSTRSVQHSLTAGVSAYAVGISGTSSWGTYSVTSDYMDLNGDGYPDFVGPSAVQYTRPWGGIGELQGVTKSNFSSSTSSTGRGFSASRPQPEHAPDNGVKNNKMYWGGIGGGISGQIGDDNTNISYMDVNADGLPDIVDAVNHRVKYNLGYSFEPNWTALPNIAVSSSSHSSISINAAGSFNYMQSILEMVNNKPAYSVGQFSISGGFSASASENVTESRLLDINGDGYPDLLACNSNGDVSVRYFDGTAYTSPQTLNIQNLQRSNTANAGFNLGVTGGFSLAIFPVKFCFGVHTTPWTTSSTVSYCDFMDVDGDGYIDQVLNTDNGLQVRYNRNGSTPVNILKSVANPTEQAILINYTLSEPSTNHRTRTWNMTMVDDKTYTFFNSPPVHTYYFSYNNQFYDNFERTDYGHSQVITDDEHTKFVVETFENSHYLNRGEKLSDLLLNENHDPIIGHSHEIRYHDILDQQQSDICNDIYLHVGSEGYWTDYYETQHTPQITTRYNKYFDARHNLIFYADDGDMAVSGDEWTKEIMYKNTTSYNMISLPRFEIIRDGSNNRLRHRHINYNSKGQPKQIIYDDTDQLIKAIYELQYDQFGNVSRLRDPSNENGQYAYRIFEYDDTTRTHVTKVENQFGEYSKFWYDLRHGIINKTSDPAGNEMVWKYDRMGRLIDIVAPDELNNNLPYSVHYIYRLPNHNQLLNAPHPYDFPHVTKIAADTGLVSTDVTIYDARGKHLQRKSWRYMPGRYEWVTDGLIDYDKWYRPYRSYDPFITDTIHIPLWIPDTHFMLPAVTYYQFDILDRDTSITFPDGNKITKEYMFAHDLASNLRLCTYRKDENSFVTETLFAPQGWTIQTKQPDNSITQYDYNPIGERTRVIDADGYKTTYNYDMFGNCVRRDHPDAGTTRWTYAPNGDVIRMITARLGIDNLDILYNYNYNRLTDIIYPVDVTNNVHYTYNSAGQISKYEDGTGSTQLSYDAMGNVNETIRRVVMPTEQYVYSFRTATKYDSFGKVRYILYPDSERVDYHYYKDGYLRSVTRTPYHDLTYRIIYDMQYDPMGHNTYRAYGNNVGTEYRYEAQRNRMYRMDTGFPGVCYARMLVYDYDNVGNITQMEQLSSACTGMGGYYLQNYTYDSQYRLNYSTGSGMPGNYDFQATYSSAGRIGHDSCWHTGTPANAFRLYGYDVDKKTHQPRVVFEYLREPSLVELFWDANGNLSIIQDCNHNRRRFHHWDEENRLRMVVGSKRAGFYGYDANGERVYKIGGESEIHQINADISYAHIELNEPVVYPNPYIVVTGKGYTKHYYANGERLATAIGTGGFHYMSPDAIDLPNNREFELIGSTLGFYNHEYPFMLKKEYFSTTTNETIEGVQAPQIQYQCPPNNLYQLYIGHKNNFLLPTMQDYQYINPHADYEIFFTHNDHLGSASWITDVPGHPVQYLHYLPYGQLLANQMLYGYDERFKFIGKERDWESGYDYFGARYYASPFMHWLSPDPLSDKDPGISPYAYCRWNPLKYVDPKGEEWLTEEDAKQATHYTQAMETRKAELVAEQSKLKNTNKIEYIQKEIDIMQKGIEELQEMGATTEQKFTYSTSHKKTDGATGRLFGVIVMEVPEGNDALGIHESSHGYDVWRDWQLPSMESEIKAYQRQFVFNESLMPISHNWPEKVSSLGQIRPTWIRGILNSKGEYPYLRLK